MDNEQREAKPPWYATIVTKQHQKEKELKTGYRCVCGACETSRKDGWKPT